MAGGLVFAADDGVHGRELWASSGSAAGTRLVQDIYPGSGNSDPGDFTRAGERLFFSANDGLTGRELWALPLDRLRPLLNAALAPEAQAWLPLVQR